MYKRKVIGLNLPDFFKISVKTRNGTNYVRIHEGKKCYSLTTSVGSEIACVMLWLQEQVKDCRPAQQALKQIHEVDASHSGALSIQKVGDVYQVESAGESSDLQLLRSLGLRLRALKSSSRKNAALVGYEVHNEGFPLMEAASAA